MKYLEILRQAELGNAEAQAEVGQLMPTDNESFTIEMLYCNIENFSWIDVILLSICLVVSLYFTLDEGISIFILVSVLVAICYISYGPVALAQLNLKKLKFPKRNYIRFFRNPNTNY
jgi:hypothetical protein